MISKKIYITLNFEIEKKIQDINLYFLIKCSTFILILTYLDTLHILYFYNKKIVMILYKILEFLEPYIKK